jgi:cytoskeletal protein CcmA (bactofilin family)
MKKIHRWQRVWSVLLCFLFFTTVVSMVFASEEGSPRGNGGAAGVSASQVIEGDYFAFGPLVEISGTVNGDVYAFGGQIMIDGRVNGDVIVAGGRVSVSGVVAQDLRALGGQVSVGGNIGRNATVAAGNFELARAAVVQGSLVAAGGLIHLGAPIGGNVKVAGGTVIIADQIKGAVNAAVGNLRITSKAQIQGNVRYLSHREASVDQGARIQGQVTRSAPRDMPKLDPQSVAIFFAGWGIVMLAISAVSTLILGLLSLRFLPRYHNSVVSVLGHRPWSSLGIGFIAAVVTPAVCAILFATLFAFPIALILTASYFILLYWGRIFVMSRIGELLFGVFRAAPWEGWTFVLGWAVYYLIALIPVIGWLMIFLMVLSGLGAELMARREFYNTARRQQLL